jgi:hypothetical protein
MTDFERIITRVLRFKLGTPTDQDQVGKSRTVLPQSGIQNGSRRTREHEIALLDAGGEELAGIFGDHPYACTQVLQRFQFAITEPRCLSAARPWLPQLAQTLFFCEVEGTDPSPDRLPGALTALKKSLYRVRIRNTGRDEPLVVLLFSGNTARG